MKTYSGDTVIEKWVLFVNVNPGGYQPGSGVRYFIGNFDGNSFTADSLTYQFLDYGSDFYAAVSYYRMKNYVDDTQKWAIGWMNNWNYGLYTPTDPWRGQMSLARSIKLRAV